MFPTQRRGGDTAASTQEEHDVSFLSEYVRVGGQDFIERLLRELSSKDAGRLRQTSSEWRYFGMDISRWMNVTEREYMELGNRKFIVDGHNVEHTIDELNISPYTRTLCLLPIRISDLWPLRNLTQLQRLSLDVSDVLDETPLQNLTSTRLHLSYDMDAPSRKRSGKS